jgi:predicted Zn-dependent protease with MMP-like domain
VEDYVRETGEPFRKVIRETIIHELAHYFGFSEEEMDAIERLWAAEGDGKS